MDAIIGKYRARMEETGLILTHPTGIIFDLTPTEAIDLVEFIKVYQAMIVSVPHGTEPGIEGVVMNGEADNNKDQADDRTQQ